MRFTFTTVTIMGLSLFGNVLAVPAPTPEHAVSAEADLSLEARQAESYPGVRRRPIHL